MLLPRCFVLLTLVSLICAVVVKRASRKKREYEPPECKTPPATWREAIRCDYKCPQGWKKFPLLIMSFDGFNRYYLNRNKTLAMNFIKDYGSHAPFMYPSFPSKTIPNHYAIVTGLYPESHGIVENKFYDPVMDKTFAMKGNIFEDLEWWKGEPIWNTAQKNGMKSATHMWAGSEVKIQGTHPSYYAQYDPKTQFSDKIDKIIEWLKMGDDERPAVINAYFNQPDLVGHDNGPYSKQINEILPIVDGVPDYLMSSLLAKDLFNCVNIIILADHGMQTLHKNFTSISNYVDITGMVIFDGGPLARITLKDSPLTTEKVLEKLPCKSDEFRAFDRKSMPTRLHYSKNPRIGDLVLMAAPGVTIWKKTKNEDEHGGHGYDYRLPSMHATFIGYGPGFKRHHLMEQPFQNVELYNLFSYMIGVEQVAPNNGTVGALNSLLVNPQSIPDFTAATTAECELGDLEACNKCPPTMKTSVCSGGQALHVAPQTDLSDTCQMSSCSFAALYSSKLSTVLAVQKTVSSEDLLPVKEVEDCLLATAGECSDAKQKSEKLENSGLILQTLLSSKLSEGQADEDVVGSFYKFKVPMYESFHKDYWHSFMEMVTQYANSYEDLRVIAGPVFDYDNDGLADDGVAPEHIVDGVPVPSHIFLVMIRCNGYWTENKCDGQPMVQSFVLPHAKKIVGCYDWFGEFVFMNTARIRDIELLTKLRFFHQWDGNEAAKLRTHVNQLLWPLY